MLQNFVYLVMVGNDPGFRNHSTTKQILTPYHVWNQQNSFFMGFYWVFTKVKWIQKCSLWCGVKIFSPKNLSQKFYFSNIQLTEGIFSILVRLVWCLKTSQDPFEEFFFCKVKELPLSSFPIPIPPWVLTCCSPETSVELSNIAKSTIHAHTCSCSAL